MAKANRKAIEESEVWNFRWVHGLFTAKVVHIDKNETKARHDEKKDRLRKEQHLINKQKFHQTVKVHKIVKQNHIQYGFDLAKWWMLQHA